MFVTISVLLDEATVISEHIHIHDSACTPVPRQHYLKARQDILSRYTYTPVRVSVMKKGSPLVHIVEFTGYHYCLNRMSECDTYYWWVNAHASTLSAIPMDVIESRYTLPLQEPELHEYVLSIASDYFNDCFHLADKE